MHNLNPESAVSGPISLLKHYSFESNHQSYEKVIDSWLERFPLNWVNLALVESLYQGRYKVVSVEQILTLWQRRGKPSYHFNHDFERLVSNKLPQTFEKKELKNSQKNNGNIRSLNYRPSSNTQKRVQPQGYFQAGRSRNSLRVNPLFAHFQSDLDQKGAPQVAQESQSSTSVELPKVVQESQSSTSVELPRNPVSRSQQAELTDLEPPVVNSPVTEEPVLEATKPITMAEEQTSEVVDSKIESDLQPLVMLSEESSDDDSQSNSSVPFSTPIGETLNPIHQFVPQSSSTEFCSKLTAMAQVNV